jgi:hypothetical protein
MTTKELLKKIENKSPFALAWSVLWRIWVLTIGAYLILLALLGILMLIA